MRRRSCKLLMPGQAYILLRPGHSDLIDFVTNLCLHTCEAIKFRALMKPIDKTLSVIMSAIDAISSGVGDRVIITNAVLHKISNLTDAHRLALIQLWPNNLLEEMKHICIHQSDYVIYTDNMPIEVSICTASDTWEMRLLAAAEELMKCSIDDSLIVDIISSNTHSIYDCLSPLSVQAQRGHYGLG